MKGTASPSENIYSPILLLLLVLKQQSQIVQMAHGLPTSVVLKSQSSNKYLRYVTDHLAIHKFLQFSGEKALSPEAMFEFEIPESARAAQLGLVHIRSTYNNRYWQRSSRTTKWIVATADEPEEDQSKWSCTLFLPSFVDDSRTRIRLNHVQLEGRVSVWQLAGSTYESCLFVGSSGEADCNDGSIFEVINRESLVVLPQYVAFKGLSGLYLNARSVDNSNILEFASSDLGDPSVAHQVITATNDDGTRYVRFKSVHFDKFWCKKDDDYISADSDDTTDGDKNTLFLPVKLNQNHVALRNMGNNLFAKRFSYTGLFPKLDYFAAFGSDISDKETNLEVFELVASTEINSVEFRLLDTRIYNLKNVTLATTEAINTGSKPAQTEIKLSFPESKSSKWDTYCHSFKLGVEVKLSSGIPCIQNWETVVKDKFEGTYKWGETMTSKISTDIVETIIVPPMSKLKVRVIAIEGTFDVPFSYTQLDNLHNGEKVTYKKDDGIYTGTGTFGYEIKKEP